jgi:hypothetical protein
VCPPRGDTVDVCARTRFLPNRGAGSVTQPTHTFVDTKPGTINILLAGAVVEGLGMGNCAYSLSSVETSTVSYINSF